jgi:hypothetical protein
MASLTDLFSPTFLIFLGILVLVVALLVVYFESKMRDQNHKIASMLSLVSTLAEDMNGVKMGLNHLSMVGGSNQSFGNHLAQNNISSIKVDKNLITVSDDESESDSDSDSESESESVCDSECDSVCDSECDSEVEDDDTNEIKVLKINVEHQGGDDDDMSFNVVEDLGDLDELDDDSDDELDSETSNTTKTNNNEDIKSFKFDISIPEDLHEETFKSISVNLEDNSNESIDYKKLALPKLRSVVSEKGLATDTSKMKKQELLKLLGSE